MKLSTGSAGEWTIRTSPVKTTIRWVPTGLTWWDRVIMAYWVLFGGGFTATCRAAESRTFTEPWNPADE